MSLIKVAKRLAKAIKLRPPIAVEAAIPKDVQEQLKVAQKIVKTYLATSLTDTPIPKLQQDAVTLAAIYAYLMPIQGKCEVLAEEWSYQQRLQRDQVVLQTKAMRDDAEAGVYGNDKDFERAGAIASKEFGLKAIEAKAVAKILQQSLEGIAEFMKILSYTANRAAKELRYD